MILSASGNAWGHIKVDPRSSKFPLRFAQLGFFFSWRNRRRLELGEGTPLLAAVLTNSICSYVMMGVLVILFLLLLVTMIIPFLALLVLLLLQRQTWLLALSCWDNAIVNGLIVVIIGREDYSVNSLVISRDLWTKSDFKYFAYNNEQKFPRFFSSNCAIHNNFETGYISVILSNVSIL